MEENKKVININILDTIKLLKGDTKMMALYLFVGAVFGVIVAFSIPKIYKTTVILAPEETSNGFSGSISSLASMVGMNMNLGQSGDAIYPEIYPDVMSSNDFLVSLFPVQITTQDKSYSSDYATYLMAKSKMPWWDYPKALLALSIQKMRGDTVMFSNKKKIDPFNLTKPEWELTQAIKGNLTCDVDKKTNVITITVQDQDPLVSASIADTVKNRLQILITNYRTKKARNDVQYLEKIFKEAKSQYLKAQYAYSGYTDAHMNAVLETVNQEGEKLKSEMDLRETIYNTVAQQLQLAKAKVQERTPAFTIIQSASVPVKHSNKPKVVILAIWVFIAFVVRCLVLIWKNKDMFIAMDSTK